MARGEKDLSEQFRQEDQTLLDILQAVRDGEWDHGHVSSILRRETDGSDIEDEVPRLYTHNEDVERLNDEKLARLKTPSRTYSMTESGSAALLEGLKRGCLSPQALVLKEGALVMCTKNNPLAGYVNGTLGKVIRFEPGTWYPVVETTKGDVLTISPMDWAVEEDGKVKAKITQLPLRLAWAITVHKSQGMSLDQAAMDLSRVFEYGQGYVALSRVRALSGLFLLGWSEQALSVHPEVLRLDGALRDSSAEAQRVFEALEETGERTTMEERFIKASGGTLDVVSRKAPKQKLTTLEETLALLLEGKSVTEIAKIRSLTLGTVADHIEKLSRSGGVPREIALEALPENIREHLAAIHAAFKKKGPEKLAPAHSFLKGKFSYDDLKLARSVYVG